MTEKSQSAVGLMKLAQMVIDHGGDHRARFDAVLDRLVEFMHEAGCSDDSIETQAKIFTNCYCAVVWAASMKELHAAPRLH